MIGWKRIAGLLGVQVLDQNLADLPTQEPTAMTQAIFPAGQTHLNPSDFSAEVHAISLGGFFYDYLRTDDNRVVGVRYHLMESVDFGNHPVYSPFLADKRFVFEPQQGFVDIVFDERDADALQRGTLQLDIVQDFGGERVLKHCGAFGIAFSLPNMTS